MSCLCCEVHSPRYCKLIRFSPPPFVRVCEVNYFNISPLSDSCPHPSPFPFSFTLSFSCLSEDGISMAKHWFESSLAEPHAWMTALMSSLRFDDVANKWTLLIIWPLNSSVTTTAPLHTIPVFFLLLHASFSPLSLSGEVLKMRSRLFEHKQGRASSRVAYPWNDSVEDFITFGRRQRELFYFNITDYMTNHLPNIKSSLGYGVLTIIGLLLFQKVIWLKARGQKTFMQVVINCPFRH